MTFLRRLPFTLAFVGVQLAANTAVGSLFGPLPRPALREWGISLATLQDGEFFRLASAVFLSHDAAMAWRQMAFALLVIGFHEWRTGTARTAALFVAIDVVATLILFLAVLPLVAGVGETAMSRLTVQRDVGMSGGGFGLVGALAAMAGARIGRRGAVLATGVAVLVLKLVLAPEVIADGLHLVAFAMGFAVVVLWPPHEALRATSPRSP